MTSSTGDINRDRFCYRLSVNYESDYGTHIDHLYVQEENLSTVIAGLPAAIGHDLKRFYHEIAEADGGPETRTFDYIKGKLFNDDSQAQTMAVAMEDFIRHPGHNIDIEPRIGRFYPATLFNSDRLKTNNPMIPLRIVELMYEEILVNTSHALCNYNTSVTLERLHLPMEDIALDTQTLSARHIPDFMTGPGMQLRYEDRATDFFSDDPYSRADDTLDSEFYSRPRHINHLDTAAQAQLKSVYKELIPADSEVLDLMSSINSHIDERLDIQKLTGLGLNKEELEANPVLDEIVIHDINQDQRLPFDDASFDSVVCSLSIEYITKPSILFDEVARILRPGGRFIISFSNRWFPTKAVQVWNNLHDFERIGLVMEHFIESAHFGEINTYSLRGVPRPVDDKHNIPLSDPIYAVWANRE
jgi:SAM-dependent methyltransferase